jgi:hypothetical protein
VPEGHLGSIWRFGVHLSLNRQLRNSLRHSGASHPGAGFLGGGQFLPWSFLPRYLRSIPFSLNKRFVYEPAI